MTDHPADLASFDPSRYERPCFFTGAGLSVESGIPTYRGRGGIWESYDISEIACQEAFDRDPEKVLDFTEYRRDLMGDCAPNRAHEVIAEVQARVPGTRIVTQNLDGLHQRAGAKSVIELHGSVWRFRCERKGTVHEELTRPLPTRRCDCGDYLRPDIVWFGDSLDQAVLGAAVDAVSGCDLLVSIGTSGVVYPAAALPQLARSTNATLVEVNPEETDLSPLFHLHLRESAATALDKLFPSS